MYVFHRAHEDVMHGCSKLDVEGCRYLVSSFQRFGNEEQERRRNQWLADGEEKIQSKSLCSTLCAVFCCCCMRSESDEEDERPQSQNEMQTQSRASLVYLMMAEALMR